MPPPHQVAVPYSNALECNNTLLDLARTVKTLSLSFVFPTAFRGVRQCLCLAAPQVVEEIEKAGGIGFYCMAPAISDGNTQVRQMRTALHQDGPNHLGL